jgi:hypothetical protein
MARRKQITTADLDGLNALLVREFNYQLTNPPVDPETGNRLPIPAAALATIVKYILASGVRPLPDSPLGKSVAELIESLPFKDLETEVNH